EELPDPRALDVLVAGIQDPEESVRRSAASALGWVAVSRYGTLKHAFIEALNDPETGLSTTVVESDDPQLRRQMARTLGYLANPETLQVLKRLSRDEDSDVTREAVLALVSIGTEEAMNEVQKKLPTASYVVASSTLDAVATEFGNTSPELFECIKLALEHDSPQVRRHAVLMLNGYETKDAADLLAKCTADEDFEVAHRAADVLRSQYPNLSLDWLGEDIVRRAGENATLAVWEAGSVGSESAEEGDEEGADDSREMLERAAMHGGPSARSNAVSELSTLMDIADSEALQKALEDDDPTMRSAAAESLDYTRNAGFLLKVLKTHDDPLVRRRALQDLIQNPGGRSTQKGPSRDLQFSSERTAPLELYSYFLESLQDEDEGVQQEACNGIRYCVETAGYSPVRETFRELDALSDREDASFMIREEASRVRESVEETESLDLAADSVDNILDWWGRLSRYATAISYKTDAGTWDIERGTGLESERIEDDWPREFGLSKENAEALEEAVQGDGTLAAKPGAAVVKRIRGLLTSGAKATAAAARGLRLAGKEEYAERLDEWSEIVEEAPAPDWGDGETLEEWYTELRRLKKLARLELALCAGALAGRWEQARPLIEDDDPWVRLMAAAALCGEERMSSDGVDEVAEAAESCAGEEDYAHPVARAGVALAEAGRTDGLDLLHRALPHANTRLRGFFTHRLTSACTDEETARTAEEWLEGRTLETVADYSIAIGLVAGGRAEEADWTETEPPEDETELRCAYLGYRCLHGDEDAANELIDMARNGESHQQLCSAIYLGVGRVRSATTVLAAVADAEVTFRVKAECGSVLVSRGHPGSVDWFQRVLKGAEGRRHALLTDGLSRGIEHGTRLMLERRDVNMGRFI
ncbi:MAG: HEAT repeat domain-containing protein, partial [Planctomycetota bacterium]